MLTLGYTPATRPTVGGLGDIDTGNIEPVFYSTLKRLENAEKMLWASFRAAMNVCDSGYALPQSYVDDHNAACEAVAAQSFDIVAQRNALPGVVVQKPSPFPKIGVVSPIGTTSTAPVSGFGAVSGMIDPGDVRVVLRYPDREEVVGGVGVGQMVATTFATLPVGGDLGITWAVVVVVAIIASVAITVSVCVTLSFKYHANSEVMQAEARRAEAKAAMAKQSHETYSATLARCVGTSIDPTIIASCADAAAKAVAAVNESIPNLPDPLNPNGEKSGLGFLRTVGLIAIVAVLTIGGVAYYKRWKRRQVLTRVPAHSTSRKDEPAVA